MLAAWNVANQDHGGVMHDAVPIYIAVMSVTAMESIRLVHM